MVRSKDSIATVVVSWWENFCYKAINIVYSYETNMANASNIGVTLKCALSGRSKSNW